MEKTFEGRVAIVTGSGQGIGRALAMELAARGCKVITNNRKPGSNVNAEENTSLDFSEEELKTLKNVIGDAESTAAAIREKGGVALPVYADLSKAEDCKRLVDTAISEFGRLDILVNNGASFFNGNIANIPIDMWERVVCSKLFGSFYMMHYAIPHMREQGYGRILNAASEAFHGLMGMAPYSAATSGVWALTKTAAQDLAPDGITVNAYTPLCRTRGWHSMLNIYRHQGVPAEILEANAPKGMLHGPEGVVGLLAYLVSGEAGGISGQMFNVEASGKVSLWSESVEFNAITRDVEKDGYWTVEQLREMMPQVMKDITTPTTSIELH